MFYIVQFHLQYEIQIHTNQMECRKHVEQKKKYFEAVNHIWIYWNKGLAWKLNKLVTYYCDKHCYAKPKGDR